MIAGELMSVDPLYFSLDSFVFPTPTAAPGTPPPAPTLSVSDNGDGTGGVATITGTDAGATVQVQYMPVTGNLTTGPWTTGGVRGGNGTISVALSPGFYFFQAVATENGSTVPSNVVYAQLTNGVLDLYERILAAALARIALLNLPDIGANVFRLKDIVANQIDVPCVVLTYFTLIEQLMAGDWAADEVGYPILCGILTQTLSDQDPVAQAQELSWRGEIADRLRYQRLPGVPEVQTCMVEPMPVAEPNYRLSFASAIDESMMMRSGQVLRFIARRPRMV